MTKTELEKDRDEWKQQSESLQADLDSLNEAYTELEEENYKLTNNISTNGVKNLSNFIFKLKEDNLYDLRMELFIQNYIRWYND